MADKTSVTETPEQLENYRARARAQIAQYRGNLAQLQQDHAFYRHQADQGNFIELGPSAANIFAEEYAKAIKNSSPLLRNPNGATPEAGDITGSNTPVIRSIDDLKKLYSAKYGTNNSGI